jgi:MFS family permease
VNSEAPTIPGRRETSTSVAATIVAAALAAMFVGATLPTPLYPLYRRTFGFGEVVLTLIYAVYVLGNLTALIVFGRLSDQIGRRNTMLPAIVIGGTSASAFFLASSTPWLFAARALSGFATGLASGAATAWISELKSRKGGGSGAVTASASNFIGLAVGPLLSGVLAQVAPWPLKLSYLVYGVLLVAVGIAILAAPETVDQRVEQWSKLTLRPRLGLPKEFRLTFVSPAVTAFITFALVGFYAALIPNLLADSLHLPGPLAGGLIVFELFTAATLATVLGGNVKSRNAMLSGLALFPLSLVLLVFAELRHSMSLLLAAAAFGGVAASFGYRGSLEVVNDIAPKGQRSEIVSSYLVAVYCGNSLPVIGVGFLSAATNPPAAHVTFAIVIALLAGAGIAVGLKYAPTE